MNQVLKQTETKTFGFSKQQKTLELKRSQRSPRRKLFKRLRDLNVLLLPKARKVQNNPPLCKSHMKRCSNCRAAVGTRTLMQVKQRKILQGRCKQSCRWGHGYDFGPHADHTAFFFFHRNGVEKVGMEWNGMEWCNRMKWNWTERNGKVHHETQWWNGMKWD